VLDKAKAATLQGILDRIVAGGAPDAIAAVITADGTWAGAAGIDGPRERQATVHDEFALASISKTFVATLVLRLVEQGKIDLDAPLSAYLDGMTVDANGATVRQALAMRSGLPDTRYTIADACSSDPKRIWTTAEVLSTFDPPIAQAGARVIYSNPTYKLLRLAAEHATGTSFATAMRVALLDPVGADRIVVQGPDRLTPKPWALPLAGHTQGDDAKVFGQGGTLPCLADSTFSIGNAMAGDAPTLAAWGWHLFAGDIVDAASLGAMEDGDGLGLERFSGFGNAIAYGHAGSKPGYGSILLSLPEEQALVVMFINDPDADVPAAAEQLLKAATSR